MSPLNAIRSTGELIQIVAMIGSVGVGAFGIGVNWGKKPDLAPQVKANTVAIDSMRVWNDSVGGAIDVLDAKVDRILCYIESEAEGFNQIRCAR